MNSLFGIPMLVAGICFGVHDLVNLVFGGSGFSNSLDTGQEAYTIMVLCFVGACLIFTDSENDKHPFRE